jgi:CheY-like chemotaxis protein
LELAGMPGILICDARLLQPDLILLDLSMPVMSGTEAASILKTMLPHTKIVLFFNAR